MSQTTASYSATRPAPARIIEGSLVFMHSWTAQACAARMRKGDYDHDYVAVPRTSGTGWLVEISDPDTDALIGFV